MHKPTLLFVSRDKPVAGGGGAATYRNSLLSFVASFFEIRQLVLPYKGSTNRSALLYNGPTGEGQITTLADPVELPSWTALPTPFEQACLLALLQRHRVDVLLLDRCWLGALATAEARRWCNHFAVLTHNVESDRAPAFALYGVSPYQRELDHPSDRWSQAAEAEVLAGADVVVGITQRDCDLFRAMLPQLQVTHAPYAPPTRDLVGTSPRRLSALFVGSESPSNTISLQWLLSAVWPMIAQRNQAASLQVVGNVANSFRGHALPPGVTFSGFVDDISTSYQQATVCVVPVLCGGGMKIKLIDALSFGMPCVVTPLALQGVEELAGRGVLVADGAEAFAEAVELLLNDAPLRDNFREFNLRFLASHHTPSAAYMPLVHSLLCHH